MDPAEIRFIQKAFIKEKGAEIFILWKPIKDSASPCTAIGISETSCQRENENRQQPFIYNKAAGYGTKNKFGNCFQSRRWIGGT